MQRAGCDVIYVVYYKFASLFRAPELGTEFGTGARVWILGFLMEYLEREGKGRDERGKMETADVRENESVSDIAYGA